MCDRKILFGIGIGMIISALFMYNVKINNSMSKAEIEEKAYSYGMKYPSDMKVIK